MAKHGHLHPNRPGTFVVYGTPNGGELVISQVNDSPFCSCSWDNCIYVGEVTDYIRGAERGLDFYTDAKKISRDPIKIGDHFS